MGEIIKSDKDCVKSNARSFLQGVGVSWQPPNSPYTGKIVQYCSPD